MDLKLIDRFSDRLYAALVCSCRLFLAADAHVGDIVTRQSEGARSDDDQAMAKFVHRRAACVFLSERPDLIFS